MEFFTADIHFCDEKCMLQENRPFKNIKAYDNFIIRDFNKTAKKGDTIYVVGDFLDCNGPQTDEWVKGLKYVKKIKADIVLIMGNNEDRVVHLFFNDDYDAFVKACLDSGIKAVYRDLQLDIWGENFYLVHQVEFAKPDRFNIFGHTHMSGGWYHPYGLCVSTDLNHFRLFDKRFILDYVKRKAQYLDADGNLNYVNPFIVRKGKKYINIRQEDNPNWKRYIKMLDTCKGKDK